MGGVYTDNQPDFSYLGPYETKTFSQFWWPIQGIGPVVNANRDAAIRFAPVEHSQPRGRGEQFPIGSVLQHSNTPSLRVAGFDDEVEDENDAPNGWAGGLRAQRQIENARLIIEGAARSTQKA